MGEPVIVRLENEMDAVLTSAIPLRFVEAE